MKQLPPSRPTWRRDEDIVDAEFFEIDSEPNVPPSRPSPMPSPAPSLGDWWRHKSGFDKAVIVIAPFIFVLMCLVIASAPKSPSVLENNAELAASETKGDAKDNFETSALATTEPAGPPTCASIEGDVARLFKARTNKNIIEINNMRSAIVDGNPQCSGSALTEVGTIFISYGVNTTAKGQDVVYWRVDMDLVIPPGMEGRASGPSSADANQESQRADTTQTPAPPADLPAATPTSDTSQPIPRASSSPTEQDLFAPHP